MKQSMMKNIKIKYLLGYGHEDELPNQEKKIIFKTSHKGRKENVKTV